MLRVFASPRLTKQHAIRALFFLQPREELLSWHFVRSEDREVRR